MSIVPDILCSLGAEALDDIDIQELYAPHSLYDKEGRVMQDHEVEAAYKKWRGERHTVGLSFINYLSSHYGGGETGTLSEQAPSGGVVSYPVLPAAAAAAAAPPPPPVEQEASPSAAAAPLLAATKSPYIIIAPENGEEEVQVSRARDPSDMGELLSAVFDAYPNTETTAPATLAAKAATARQPAFVFAPDFKEVTLAVRRGGGLPPKADGHLEWNIPQKKTTVPEDEDDDDDDDDSLYTLEAAHTIYDRSALGEKTHLSCAAPNEEVDLRTLQSSVAAAAPAAPAVPVTSAGKEEILDNDDDDDDDDDVFSLVAASESLREKDVKAKVAVGGQAALSYEAQLDAIGGAAEKVASCAQRGSSQYDAIVASVSPAAAQTLRSQKANGEAADAAVRNTVSILKELSTRASPAQKHAVVETLRLCAKKKKTFPAAAAAEGTQKHGVILAPMRVERLSPKEVSRMCSASANESVSGGFLACAAKLAFSFMTTPHADDMQADHREALKNALVNF